MLPTYVKTLTNSFLFLQQLKEIEVFEFIYLGYKLSANDIAALQSLNIEVARTNVMLLSKAFISIFHNVLSQPEKPIREYQEMDETYMFYDLLENDFEEMNLFGFLQDSHIADFVSDLEQAYFQLHHCVDTGKVLMIVGRLQYLDCILQKQIIV